MVVLEAEIGCYRLGMQVARGDEDKEMESHRCLVAHDKESPSLGDLRT